MDERASEALATTGAYSGRRVGPPSRQPIVPTTELALLATDPGVLITSSRFAASDLAGQRVIARVDCYIRLLRDNFHLQRRFQQAGGRARHPTANYLDDPPAFPFDEPAWDAWLLPPARATLEVFDVARMPLPISWDARPPFSSALELIEHIDTTWAAAADRWRQTARRILADAGNSLENAGAEIPVAQVLPRTDGRIRADDERRQPQWHQGDRWMFMFITMPE